MPATGSASGPRAAPGPSVMRPLVLHPVRYLWTNRSTHSDVMATSTTTEISALGGATKLPSRGASSSGGFSRTIQLPSFLGTHLASHVSVPSNKAAALVRERDAFMRRLEQERNDRSVLETWAAIRIQAIVRAHLARLRVDNIRASRGLKPTDDARRRQHEREARKRRRRPEIYEDSKFDADRLRAQLAQLTAETDMYMQLVTGSGGGGKGAKKAGGGRPDWKKHLEPGPSREGAGAGGPSKKWPLLLCNASCAAFGAPSMRSRRSALAISINTEQACVSRYKSGGCCQLCGWTEFARCDARRLQLSSRGAPVGGLVVYMHVCIVRLNNIQLEDTSALAIQICWRKSRSACGSSVQSRIWLPGVSGDHARQKGARRCRTKLLLREEQRHAATRIRLHSGPKRRGKKWRLRVRPRLRKNHRQRQHEAAAVKVQALHRGKNARAAYREKVHTRREGCVGHSKAWSHTSCQAAHTGKRRRREEARSHSDPEDPCVASEGAKSLTRTAPVRPWLSSSKWSASRPTVPSCSRKGKRTGENRYRDGA